MSFTQFPNINVRVTTALDTTIDAIGYVNDESLSLDLRVLALKSNIIRSMLQTKIVREDMPMVLNTISDKVYASVIKGEKNSIPIMANYIIACLGSSVTSKPYTLEEMIKVLSDSIKGLK